MDRFCFRVYDKKNKQYIDGVETEMFINNDASLLFDSFGDVVFPPEELSNYIIEQCTGLKDKNGNLIYIGDIIKCGNGPLSTATVQYENGENFIDGIYPFNLYHDCGDECHCQLRDYPEYACEIIGNIHEQKDNK